MNHKIVCWGDYAIPVKENMHWLAMDRNGTWYVYRNKPRATTIGYWGNAGEIHGVVNSEIGIFPPEPGGWRSQLYWIGD